MSDEEDNVFSDEVDSDVETLLYSQIHHEWCESVSSNHDLKAFYNGTITSSNSATGICHETVTSGTSVDSSDHSDRMLISATGQDVPDMPERNPASSSTTADAELKRNAEKSGSRKQESLKRRDRKSRNIKSALKSESKNCNEAWERSSTREDVIVLSSGSEAFSPYEEQEQQESKYAYHRKISFEKEAANSICVTSKKLRECKSRKSHLTCTSNDPDVICISSDSDSVSFDGPLPETDLYVHMKGAMNRETTAAATTTIAAMSSKEAAIVANPAKRKRNDAEDEEEMARSYVKSMKTREQCWKDDVQQKRKSLDQVVDEAMRSFYDSDCTEFEVEEVKARSHRNADGWFLHADDTFHSKLSRREYDRIYNRCIVCDNCCQKGHIARNCPEPKKEYVCHLCAGPDHGYRRCDRSKCSLCGKDHPITRCHMRMNISKMICQSCGQTGHIDELCPDRWRRFHLTTTPGPLNMGTIPTRLKNPSLAWCCNCGRKGHFVHECKKKRMDDSPPPVSSQVISYTIDPVIRKYRPFQEKAVKTFKADKNWNAMKQRKKFSPKNGIFFNKRNKNKKMNSKNQTGSEGYCGKSNRDEKRFYSPFQRKRFKKNHYNRKSAEF